MRLLLTGDIHIGRASSSLSGTSGRDDTRAAAAWGRIVDLAIEERVDLLCLSGDIVDKENKLWEAVGPLESGVQRLAAHGIRIVAVAGNHDFDVLMRLDDVLQSGPAAEAFHLLGRRGEWERFTIEEDGQAVLHVDGWSFPREHVYESPLESYDLKPDSSTPVLGLVHGDLDVSGSRYAPLDSVRLMETGPDAWLLGHIHKPQLFRPSGNRWALYPGSPQALDFGEPGVHGVWLVDVGDQIGVPEMRPISTVRFDEIDIDVRGAKVESDVEAAIVRQFCEAVDEAAEAGSPYLQSVAFRIRLIGRTPIAHRLEEITKSLEDDFSVTRDGVAARVEGVRISALPDVDIEAYAEARSAPGAVARLLLELDAPEPSAEVSALISRTMQELARADGHKYFAPLRKPAITNEIARAYLRDQAHALLTQLVQQAP